MSNIICSIIAKNIPLPADVRLKVHQAICAEKYYMEFEIASSLKRVV
jgi:hypothetical protein